MSEPSDDIKYLLLDMSYRSAEMIETKSTLIMALESIILTILSLLNSLNTGFSIIMSNYYIMLCYIVLYVLIPINLALSFGASFPSRYYVGIGGIRVSILRALSDKVDQKLKLLRVSYILFLAQMVLLMIVFSTCFWTMYLIRLL